MKEKIELEYELRSKSAKLIWALISTDNGLKNGWPTMFKPTVNEQPLLGEIQNNCHKPIPPRFWRLSTETEYDGTGNTKTTRKLIGR